MQALVVFESMFGNTQEVARAIADGLSTRMGVEIVEVGVAERRADVDLLVVGGPTHAFGMTRPRTRADAAQQQGGPVISGGDGVREWLESLGDLPSGVRAAAFDTRVSHPRMPGSAAHAIHKRLRRAGAELVADPASFWVEGSQGPLLIDETSRAREWGVMLAGKVAVRPGEAPRPTS